MNRAMRVSLVVAGYLVFACLPATAQQSAGEKMAAQIGPFLQSHAKLLEAQNAEAAIANLHSKGKNREKSVQDLRTKLPQMPFKYRILNVRYIGTDGEFHYIRYTQHTIFDKQWQEMAEAPGIEMDVVTILAQEDGKWKIFDTYMFSQTKLAAAGEKPAGGGGKAAKP